MEDAPERTGSCPAGRNMLYCRLASDRLRLIAGGGGGNMAENMQEETFDTRTRRLIGEEAAQRLRNAKVAVFGIGGVGSYCVEALARCGVGHLVLTDGDRVSPSNLNRQLIALHSTVGCLKTEAAARRIADICPETKTELHSVYFTAETESQFDFSSYHYIIDAVDMVSAKLLMIEKAEENGTPIISCMGTGNKLDPTRFEIADIYQTSECPLARVMRTELRKRGIPKLRVVYSREKPMKPAGPDRVPGSISFVPAAAGLILAGEAVRQLLHI